MKVGAMNLEKASLSPTAQFKPIHELECNGTITQDHETWIVETHILCKTNFGNPNNTNEQQFR